MIFIPVIESNDIGRRKIARHVKLKKLGPNTEPQSTMESYI